MMTRRFRRKHRVPGERQESWLTKVPAGVYWTLVTLVVLGFVLTYDQRQQRTARDHVAEAAELERRGELEDALEEYRVALSNNRFSRKRRGEVALHVAELYADKLNNPERARYYFNRARYLYPKAADAPEVREKFVKLMASGKVTSGSMGSRAADSVADSASTGPVVARIGDEEVRAGAVHRAMANSAPYNFAVRSGDVNALQESVNQYVDDTIVYMAAMDAGMDDDPSINEKLELYKRQLMRDQYRLRMHSDAASTAEKVRRYYQENREKYAEPGRVSIGLIKLPNKQRAAEAQEQLRAKVAFEDVATSFSIDEFTSTSRGMLGYVDEPSARIPGVANAGSIIKTLMRMKPNQVTQPMEHAGAFYIFKVYNLQPGRIRSLAEVRSSIEAEVNKQMRTESARSVEALRKKYGVQIDVQGMKQYVQFAAGAAQATNAQGSARPTTGTVTAAK